MAETAVTIYAPLTPDEIDELLVWAEAMKDQELAYDRGLRDRLQGLVVHGLADLRDQGIPYEVGRDLYLALEHMCGGWTDDKVERAEAAMQRYEREVEGR